MLNFSCYHGNIESQNLILVYTCIITTWSSYVDMNY